MLPEQIKENISSISESELTALYQDFRQNNADSSIGNFISDLYQEQKISSKEYKDFQTQEKIDLVDGEEVDDLESTLDKLKSIPEGETYTILESIDKGAMGEILIARDNKLGRTVAYKKILKTVAEYPTFMSRFIMEAQITARLEHPSIIPVYALMTHGDEIGYAMKLINGITMRDLIKETEKQCDEYGKPDEKHTLQARLDHFLKVCDAIHYAHRKGVVHRDLKPINIMIGHYNEVYVMDWGIAKIVKVDQETFDDKTIALDSKDGVERDFDKTRVGQVMGTPAYMSPEQAEGENDVLDHRSDLYSLGLILFEIVTLQKAISGNDPDEVHMKAVMGKIDPPPPYAKQKDEQEQLLAIVKKATQYRPQERYATVEEFAADIRRFMHGEPIHIIEESIIQKIMRWISQHRRATINIVVLTLFSSMVMFAVLMYLYLQMIKDML